MKKILVSIILLIILVSLFYKKENFIQIVPYKQGCSNKCGKILGESCLNCINCGQCLTSKGIYECVEGNEFGPLFRSDCQEWRYGKVPNVIIPNLPLIDLYEFSYEFPYEYPIGINYTVSSPPVIYNNTYQNRHHRRPPRPQPRPPRPQPKQRMPERGRR